MSNRAFMSLIIGTCITVLVSLLGFNAYFIWQQNQENARSNSELKLQQVVMQKDLSSQQEDIIELKADVKSVAAGVTEIKRTLKEDWEPVATGAPNR